VGPTLWVAAKLCDSLLTNAIPDHHRVACVKSLYKSIYGYFAQVCCDDGSGFVTATCTSTSCQSRLWSRLCHLPRVGSRMLLRSLYQLNRRRCKLIIVQFNLSAVWQKIIEMLYKYQFHFLCYMLCFYYYYVLKLKNLSKYCCYFWFYSLIWNWFASVLLFCILVMC